MFQGGPLKLAVRLGKGHCAFGLAVAQMPDHPATDDGGQINAFGEAFTVLFVGQDIGRQRQVTLEQHADQAVLAQGADQTIEGHGRDMTDGRAPLQTETAMGGHQGLPGHIRAHASIAQDEMRQHGKDRLASRALNAPDGETAEANPDIMGVAGQTATAVTGRFVVELKAQREDEGQDELDERLAIVKELEVGEQNP